MTVFLGKIMFKTDFNFANVISIYQSSELFARVSTPLYGVDSVLIGPVAPSPQTPRAGWSPAPPAMDLHGSFVQGKVLHVEMKGRAAADPAGRTEGVMCCFGGSIPPTRNIVVPMPPYPYPG